MTLHEYPDVEQGSEKWHDLRRGIVTASTVGRLITEKRLAPATNENARALALLLVAERITGWTDPTYQNFDMMRGVLDEPVARDLYSKNFAPVAEMGFMIRDAGAWRLGFSPDGLVGDDGLIEVKSRRQKSQVSTVLAGEVPLANMAQCQAGLLVSGREWLDYVSFSGGMHLYVKRVVPDPMWFEAIIEAVETFEENAAEMAAKYQAATEGLPTTERSNYDMEMSL